MWENIDEFVFKRFVKDKSVIIRVGVIICCDVVVNCEGYVLICYLGWFVGYLMFVRGLNVFVCYFVYLR